MTALMDTSCQCQSIPNALLGRYSVDNTGSEQLRASCVAFGQHSPIVRSANQNVPNAGSAPPGHKKLPHRDFGRLALMCADQRDAALSRRGGGRESVSACCSKATPGRLTATRTCMHHGSHDRRADLRQCHEVLEINHRYAVPRNCAKVTVVQAAVGRNPTTGTKWQGLWP